MSILNWPKGERPREKLINQGASSLSDCELLAIFLRTGLKGRSAVELSRDLLKQSNGLSGLLNLQPSQLHHYKGLGMAKYAQILAALELGRRHLNSQMKQVSVIESPQASRQYLHSILKDEINEHFGCLFLDTRHRVIEYETLFKGSINSSAVHPRVVVQRALHFNAAAVLLVHNHPSGIAEPSQADLDITRTLKKTLGLIEVNVLDHLIVGDNEIRSLAEHALI